MKKLLSIISYFGITLPSSLSIISCFNSKISHNQTNEEVDTLQKDSNSSNEQNQVGNPAVTEENFDLNQQTDGTITSENIELTTANQNIITKLTDQQKVDAVAIALNTIESNKEVELIAADLTVAKLKTAILKLKEYNNAFRNGASLKPASIILTSSSGEVLSSDNITLTDEDIINIQGIVKTKTAEKEFTFTIQVKEINTEKNQ